MEDGLIYQGILRIEIDPAKRINFSYTPQQDSARQHYEQDMQRQSETGAKVHPVSDLSIRLDLDPKAPNGISLDIGRSQFDGEQFSRPGDVVGKVMAAGSPEGSHTYEGFTQEMVDQFRPLAEELVVHQYLMERRQQEKLQAHQEGGRYEPRPEEAEADIRRYLENRPPDWNEDLGMVA